ncbi:MAG: NAD-dependent epimerase [Leptolyngbyaceae cyanobacterium SM1_1_3]|nr:NAD-dependent epimerase [Leptolyngbyaceae cyanobacterium SM1_1_3]NJO11229.1 NAD-dependent epimerase [Leptolyngbyaceae cyanobacterium SL_1_1]
MQRPTASPILVTGAAGFIGFYVCQTLLNRGHTVVGVDNLNAYYDVTLKLARLDELRPYPKFSFERVDLSNRSATEQLFTHHRPQRVIHLAAQPGVRYSIENPHAYVDSNLVGFMNVLEGCRHQGVEHLVYASSSSVYGANRTLPFATDQNVDQPISLYAATKKANELMAHTYSHLYGIPTTGLRFFTVYGPWGRPDMALFKFTKAIVEGKPIQLYNYGQMERDFIYIDDIVDGVVRVLAQPLEVANPPKVILETENPALAAAPHRLFNIGNHRPVALLHFVETLETALGITAQKQLLPMQPGDVPATYADISDLTAAVGFVPRTPIEVGIPKFVDWYCRYYGVSRDNDRRLIFHATAT